MFDAVLRRRLEAPLARAATVLDRPWLTPDRITVAGLVLGLGSAAAAALGGWGVAAALWLLSRAADGLDGPLARHRGPRDGGGPDGRLPGSVRSSLARRDAPSGGRVDDSASEAGGFLDITCDFAVYGTTVVGVAIGAAAGYGAPWWPFLLVLLAYYVNGTAFLAFSSIAERTGRRLDDGRSLSFLGGLAEGAETIAVHTLWLLLPFWADEIAIGWAALVAVGAVQRVAAGYAALR